MDNEEPDTPTFSVFSGNGTCENCNSTREVQKFEGRRLCKSCRNQWAAMN